MPAVPIQSQVQRLKTLTNSITCCLGSEAATMASRWAFAGQRRAAYKRGVPSLRCVLRQVFWRRFGGWSDRLYRTRHLGYRMIAIRVGH